MANGLDGCRGNSPARGLGASPHKTSVASSGGGGLGGQWGATTTPHCVPSANTFKKNDFNPTAPRGTAIIFAPTNRPQNRQQGSNKVDKFHKKGYIRCINEKGEQQMAKRKVNISLDENVYQKLVTLSEKNGLSKSAILAVLINEKYDRLEK